METLCNTPEEFTREISHLFIYDASILSFNENYKGQYPPVDKHLLKIPVQTIDTYKRKFSLKRQNKNKYFKIDIAVEFYDLTFENRELLYSYDNDRKYLVVAVSNKEMMVLGNNRERLSIDIIDKINDNGKGKDHFLIRVTGETIIFPMLRKVTEPFRVLFFAHPFA
ncbi:conserved hypothetical protein [Tenacibaculum maritimum]|uniref:hypothetical protein n=1 Tax=Tenacibaculum maritimum TaxID=107401 RepID=UPI0012E63DBE|nr:hypothetical protein [Tenacibaculum maritimum]CAA0170706.1 conserved hypothetical protein [Tenacibaculum maritimum]CAA0173128.1 conserved hypothetical protein [Tenacibaculum maritimum]